MIRFPFCCSSKVFLYSRFSAAWKHTAPNMRNLLIIEIVNFKSFSQPLPACLRQVTSHMILLTLLPV